MLEVVKRGGAGRQAGVWGFSFGVDAMVGGVGGGEEEEEGEEEAEEKWMNKGDVYFGGQPRCVHLKIGFVVIRRNGRRRTRRGESLIGK